MLICSAGMSTSLLVSKMQKSALNQGLDVEIWAVGASGAKKDILKADVILLGPQVRFMNNEFIDLANGKPVDIIDIRAYGRIDGNAVLEQAVKMLNL
jgi:PTS system cellobiose-specific IIB component